MKVVLVVFPDREDLLKDEARVVMSSQYKDIMGLLTFSI